MKDYSAMSDGQIAEEVAKFIELGDRKQKGDGTLYINNNVWTRFDPCNNPADAWPIIVENGITLIKCTAGSGHWSAEIITDIDEVTDNLFQCQSSFDYQDANPLRAGMIVFLKMKEGE